MKYNLKTTTFPLHKIAKSETFNQMEKAMGSELFESLLACSPEAIVIAGLDGKIILATPRTAELYGYQTPGELLGLNISGFAHPDNRQQVVKNMEIILDKPIRDIEHPTFRKDGTSFPASISLAAVKNSQGKPIAIVSVIKDITVQKIREEEALHAAFHDQQTGLYNRRFFEEEIDRLQDGRRYPITIIMIDLNYLKTTNDGPGGHTAGDRLINETAACMKKSFRTEDLKCRYGGDEFVVVIPETDDEISQILTQKLQKNLEAVNVSASIGVATAKDRLIPLRDTLRKAEQQMYKQKNSKRITPLSSS